MYRLDVQSHSLSNHGTTSRCTTLAVTPFEGKYQTSYLTAIAMFTFYSQYGHLKSLTLKIYVKVIEYNICSHAVRWRISTSLNMKKIRMDIFALYVTFLRNINIKKM